MKPGSWFSISCLGLCISSAAFASGYGVTQHGGRGAAQAGALTARADDASAVAYNPAGLAFLDGVQALAGIDFSAPRDDFRSQLSHTAGSSGEGNQFSASHKINPPPALYFSWKPAAARWALGIGFDAPFWNNIDWLPVAFPLRSEAWKTQMLLFEVHPVAAYKLNDRWSVAAGLRVFQGSFEAGRETRFGPETRLAPSFDSLAANKIARGSGDGVGFDLSLLRRAEHWGFGATLLSAASVEGRVKVAVGTEGHLPPPGVLSAEQRAPHSLGVELPLELRAGVWYSPLPRMRVEIDAALARWSATDNRLPWLPICPLSATCESTGVRQWNDTLSLRLGVEHQLTQNWVVSGGLAAEPSPVPSSTAEPGFPRGDALVYALGTSYNFPQVSFDLGYSFHDHDAVRQSRGTFSSHDQVFAVSARWRR